VSKATLAPACTAPVGTVANPTFGTVTDTSIVVNWSTVTNASGYQLIRCTGSNCSSSTILYSGTNKTYTNTGLIASTTYYYKVIAFGAAGCSGKASAIVSKATLAASPGCSSVSNGGFESGNFSGWTTYDSGESWFGEEQPLQITSSDKHSGSYSAFFGSRRSDVRINRVVGNIGQFTVKWWYKTNVFHSKEHVYLEIDNDDDPDSGVLASYEFPQSTTWTEASYTYTGTTSTSTRIRFRARDLDYRWYVVNLWLDDVSLCGRLCLNPGTPSAPTFGRVRANSVEVKWERVTNATSYELQRSELVPPAWKQEWGDFVTIAWVPSAMTDYTYTDRSVKEKVYRYRVVAHSGPNCSKPTGASATVYATGGLGADIIQGIWDNTIQAYWDDKMWQAWHDIYNTETTEVKAAELVVQDLVLFAAGSIGMGAVEKWVGSIAKKPTSLEELFMLDNASGVVPGTGLYSIPALRTNVLLGSFVREGVVFGALPILVMDQAIGCDKCTVADAAEDITFDTVVLGLYGVAKEKWGRGLTGRIEQRLGILGSKGVYHRVVAASVYTGIYSVGTIMTGVSNPTDVGFWNVRGLRIAGTAISDDTRFAVRILNIQMLPSFKNWLNHGVEMGSALLSGKILSGNKGNYYAYTPPIILDRDAANNDVPIFDSDQQYESYLAGQWYPVIDRTTSASASCPSTPSAPTFSGATPNSVTVNWTAVPEARYYELQRCDGLVECTNLVTIPTLFPSTTTSYTDTGLATGAPYRYWVIAYSDPDRYRRVAYAANVDCGLQISPAGVIFLPGIPGLRLIMPTAAPSLGCSRVYGGFGVTASSYDENSNWDQAVHSECGSDYRVADWNDLVSYYNKNGAASFTLLMDGLGVKTTAAAVYWNGQKLYGGWRAYFIEWHNHNKPGYFWAHDNIDNYLVSLGSWTGARPILIVKKADFRVTASAYDENSNWDQAVQNEFGSDYRVADWNDLVSYYNKNGAASFTLLMDGLGVKTTAAAVYWNGQKLYGGWRAYFIEWHNHNKPGYFWAHDNIDNYLVSLGSWTGARPILVVKK